MKRIISIALTVWLAMVLLDAPLRYYLTTAGIPEAVYVRDFLLSLIAGVMLASTIATLKLDTRLAIALAVIVYGGILGLWHGLGAAQVLFGFKLFLPALIGLMIVPLIGIRTTTMLSIFRIATPIVLLGLILDIFISLPWVGFTYEIAGQTVEASRDWSMSGVPRLGGFGRASFDVAAQLVCLLGLYFIAEHSGANAQQRLRCYDWPLIALSFVGIFLTTSKSALVAALLLSAVWFTLRLYRISRPAIQSLLQWGTRAGMALMIVYAVVPPLAAVTVPRSVTSLLKADNALFNLLTASFVDRMERMWPRAFDLLNDGYGLFTGRGLGGIGTAQIRFEHANYNAADNLFVYLTVSFGLIATVLLIAGLVHLIPKLQLGSSRFPAAFMLLLIVCGFGATLNVVESASLSVTGALCLSLLSRSYALVVPQEPGSSPPRSAADKSSAHATENHA